MRFIKIVRLQKYGLFGLGLKRSPNWAPMVPQKRVIRAQFGAGWDEVRREHAGRRGVLKRVQKPGSGY